MNKRNIFLLSSLLVASIAPLSGCDADDSTKPGLPPATGAGAPEQIKPPPVADGTPVSEQGSEPTKFVGSLQAKNRVELSPRGSGTITAIEVEEGDRVEAGQRVFKLDASQMRLQVSQAKAGLSGAEVQLAQAEREFQRIKGLRDKGSVATAKLDQAESAYEAAQAGVAQAKAALSASRDMAGDMAVYSPITGVVTHKLKQVGELATMMPPTVVLVIEDLEHLELRFRAPESVLGRTRVGDPLALTVPSLGTTLEVELSRIGDTVDPRTHTVELIARVENADRILKPGMFVEVQLGKPKAAPEAAATPSNEGGGEAEGGEAETAAAAEATAKAAVQDAKQEDRTR